ncbi:MAG TPA: GGDEF domain-containing protein [Polyangia bacterium]|nr:GGDEF domain-containing protein [Polyangia bacterium]
MSTRDDDEEATQVPPPPPTAAPPTAFLIVLQGLTAGHVVTLDRPACIIGRADESDLRLADRAVSAIHAVIHVAIDGLVTIEDLDSTNGTRVNDQRITAIRPLHDGDKISIGATTILKFTYDGLLKDALAAQLTAGARIDALTGAHRERFFNEVFHEEFAYARRHKTPLCLAVISIDHFHSMVSKRGAKAGDQVLAEFGRRARGVLSTEHLFGRLGLRSFAVLYRGLSSTEASALTDEVRKALSASPVTVGGEQLVVTLSAGVSMLPFPGIDNAQQLMRFADLALVDAQVTHDSVVTQRLPLAP